jgi:hypothetical protein
MELGDHLVMAWSAVAATGIEGAPTAAVILLMLAGIWVIWRGAKGLIRSIGGTPRGAPIQHERLEQDRIEPVLGPATSSPAPILNAADVFALKASIDALTHQVAALERRLAPSPVAPRIAPHLVKSNEDPPAASAAPPILVQPRIVG